MSVRASGTTVTSMLPVETLRHILCECDEGLEDPPKVLAMPAGRVCKNATAWSSQDNRDGIEKAESSPAYNFEEDEKYREQLANADDPTRNIPGMENFKPTLPPGFQQFMTVKTTENGPRESIVQSLFK